DRDVEKTADAQAQRGGQKKEPHIKHLSHFAPPQAIRPTRFAHRSCRSAARGPDRGPQCMERTDAARFPREAPPRLRGPKGSAPRQQGRTCELECPRPV